MQRRCFSATKLRPICVVAWIFAFLTLSAGTLRSEDPNALPTGLPKTVESYVAERNRLRATDAALHFDATIELTAQEQLLDEHLSKLRGALTKEYRAAKRFPPAEPFHRVKEEI